MGLAACGKKPIPEYKGKIFSVDIENQVVRYRYDEEIIPLSEMRLHGAVLFLADDFQLFTETYVMGCKEWHPSLKLAPLEEVVKEQVK